MGQSIRKFTETPQQNQPLLGARVIFDIPPTSDLDNILIQLSGVVTLSAGSTGLITDGIANIIQSIELIGDGRDPIVSFSGPQAINGNMFRRKKLAAAIVTQPGVGIAAQPFAADMVIDLAQFGAIRPKDAALRENAYRTLQLAVRFAADWTGVFAGGFAVSATTLALVVALRESIEMGDGSEPAGSPIFRALTTGRDDAFAGAVTRQRFRLSPDQALRGIGIRIVSNAVPPVLSDTLLSRVRVSVGKDVRLDLTAGTIKEMNRNNMITPPNVGYYFLDFADGAGAPDKMNDALDLRNAIIHGADAYFEYDTLGAGVANVTQFGLVPLV